MGYFPPEVPPPEQQDSPATAGEQNVEYRIGPGMYEIISASIHSANAFSEEARISYLFEHSDTTTSEMCLESGEVSENQPFTLKTRRVIEGPGWIRGYVINLDAVAFTFRVNYHKYSEGQKAGGFGRWF